MSAQFRDYYETLGVSKTAGPDEIKSAFRKLARKFHPDTAKDKKAAEEKFKEINEAYEVLGDPEKRRKYDELGPNWQQQGPPPGWQQPGGNAGGFSGVRGGPGGTEFHFGGTGFSDFFEQMFGGGMRGGRGFSGYEERPERGDDVEADILVTLEEAFHGSTRSISFRRGETGKVETYTVKIPKGIREGQRIRLAGQGGSGAAGGSSGDLYLRVKYQKHPDFEIDGNNLVCELEIPAWDAALGSEAHVRTLEGRAKLRIPPGTSSGKKFRLPGLGLPEKGGQRGDLLAVVSVTVPPAADDAERNLWHQIAARHT
ncbi:MAG: J domain-containing protein [Terrimicrobiaceae bacterium]|nr:J domain-containing protein [Terrimicrobiaceae bacterium]